MFIFGIVMDSFSIVYISTNFGRFLKIFVESKSTLKEKVTK